MTKNGKFTCLWFIKESILSLHNVPTTIAQVSFEQLFHNLRLYLSIYLSRGVHSSVAHVI